MVERESNMALTASKTPTSTIHTYLMHLEGSITGTAPTSSDLSKFKKVMDIKDYPDMGGKPDTIETTTLSDDTQTSVNGVQKLDSFEFTANYTKESYASMKAIDEKGNDEWWALYLGAAADGTTPDGHDGIFVWKGGSTTYLTSGATNKVREMKTYISAGTKPVTVEPAGA